MSKICVFILFFLALALQASAANEKTETCCDEGKGDFYNGLRVTWRKKKSCPGAFEKLPRTECEAEKMGFRKLKCECSGSTLGFGYAKGDDKGLIVLYDKQGTVCGTQVQFRKEDMDKIKEFFPVDENVPFQPTEYDGEEFYTTAVYFMNPKKICTEGRSEEELEKGGTLEQLYFQSGRNPKCDVIAIPFNEEGLKGTTWVKGDCIPGMGSHYLKDYKNYDCRHFFPFAPTYNNKGQLLSVSYGSFGCLHSTPRFDHHRDNYLKIGFPKPVACCLYSMINNTGGFTTMRVYFIDKPWEISCCS